jgi:hypothetical protein
MQPNVDVPKEYPKFEVTEGTQALDAKYKPTDLAVGDYFIPNALGHSEHEDLAARIVRMGQAEGKFVAPSYRAIGEQVIGEIEEAQKREAAQRARHEVPTKSLMQSIRGGLSRLMGKKTVAAPVQEDVQAEEESQLPFSVLAFNCRFNPQSLPAEIRGMIDKGYLNLVSKDDNDFLEPTEKLVEAILAAQKSRQERASQ